MGNNDSSFTDIPAQNMSPLQIDFALFHHHDLLTAEDTDRPWDPKKLVHKLNHLNLIDSLIFLIFRNNRITFFSISLYYGHV